MARTQPIPIDSTSPPRPLLSQHAEARLGPRHREVLDQLESLFLAEGFASFSVRELAAGVGCSRRTLYELAPSKDELVLVVLDRFLHRVGRTALESIDPSRPVAEQLREYYRGGRELQRQTVVFSNDLAGEPAARRLLDRHFRYAMAVMERLVAAGIESGEFRPVTPTVVAGILAGGGLYFNQPGVLDDLDRSNDAILDEVIDLAITAIRAA
jgi:AcrR family transcriptional regulator